MELDNQIRGKLQENICLSCDFHKADTIGDGTCFYHSMAYILNFAGYRSQPRHVQTKLGRTLRYAVQHTLREPTLWLLYNKKKRETAEMQGLRR